MSDPNPLAEIYSYYDRIRTNDPVHWDPVLRVWALTRYADVTAALMSPALSSARPEPNVDHLPTGAREQARSLHSAVSRWLLRADPPEHTRLRAFATQALRIRRVESLGDYLGRVADELLEHSPGETDIVSQLARPLTLAGIGALIGIPPEHRFRFQIWADRIGAAMEGSPDAALAASGHCSLANASSYLSGLLERDCGQRQDTLLGALRSAEVKGSRLNNEEIVGLGTLLMLAGSDTAVHAIANGVLVLLEHPDQMHLLRTNPALTESAANEALRYHTPLQGVLRLPVRDFEIGGKRIAEGQTVVAWLAAANRDPTQLVAPGSFDVTRNPNPHVAFGHGIHYCLGARLGLLLIETAMTALLRRASYITLAQTVHWQGNYLFRAQRSLRVCLRR